MFSLYELSKRVRYLRTEKTEYKAPIDVFKFTEVIRIGPASYNNIENGYNMPSEIDLLTIAEFYKVSPEWILTGIATGDYEAQLNEEIKIQDEIDKENLRKLEEEFGL